MSVMRSCRVVNGDKQGALAAHRLIFEDNIQGVDDARAVLWVSVKEEE